MEAKNVFYQIADAVSYLHGRSICHRDLKCENVLMRRDQSVALTDFGFSKLVSVQHPLSETYCGSAAYASPELLRGKPYNPFVTDIWSLGCVLFVLISGQMPFYEKNTKKMMCRQLQGRVLYPEHCSVSKTCKDLVGKTLEPNSDRRVDIAGVLSHQWLSDQRGRLPSRSSKIAGAHLQPRNVCSDVKNVESMGFSHGSTDVDGGRLWTIKSSSHSSAPDVPIEKPKGVQTWFRVHEYESSESSTQYQSSDEGTFQKRELSASSTNDNQSKGNKEMIIPGMKTQNLEILSQHSNSNLLRGTVSGKKVPPNMLIASDVHKSNKAHIPEDRLDATMNINNVEKVSLTGTPRVAQAFKLDMANTSPATEHKRSIDLTFQRDIENILRVPVTKYSQKRSGADAGSRTPAFKRVPEIEPLITICHEGTSSQSFQTTKLPVENAENTPAVGKSIAPARDAKEPLENPSRPSNRDSKPGKSKKVDIASERFHVRQEGLVAQMRRIFESKEATTNTQLTRKANYKY